MKTEGRITPPEVEDGRPVRLPEPEPKTSYLYAVLSLAGIWVAVIVTSIFAPDLVSGTTQEHFPLALIVALLAGLAATKSIVRAYTNDVGGSERWPVYTAAVLVIWAAVALVSIYAPVTVTGTDPTRLPIAAIVAPIAGSILTGAITEMFAASKR